MKAALPYIVLVAILVALGAWVWSGAGVEKRAEQGDFHVICTAANCGHEFTFDRDEAKSYPRGPNGEGFKCPKCNQFTGQLAKQCNDCQRWFVPKDTGQGRSSPCPYCSKN